MMKIDACIYLICSVLFFFSDRLLAQSAARGSMEAKKKTEEITLMGIGDSITEGGDYFSSYLFPLHALLVENGFEVSFIGPRQSENQGVMLKHAGYSGKSAEYLASISDSVYTEFPADIVLVHSGHNHFDYEKPIEGIIKSLQEIVINVKSKNPDALVFIAQVITSGKLPKYSYIPELNSQIERLVVSLRENYEGIFLVPVNRGFDWETDTVEDKVHPNAIGASKIAQNWMQVLGPQLKSFQD